MNPCSNKKCAPMLGAVLAIAITNPAYSATTYQTEFAPEFNSIYSYPEANGVNVNGVVIGTELDGQTDTGSTAVQWDASGAIADITPHGYDFFDARAIAINKRDQVLVAKNTSIYLLDHGSSTLVQTGLLNSNAFAMNDAGNIVGYYEVAINNARQFHAFVYTNGTSTDLGTLAANYTSIARDINNLGQIVGYAFDANNKSRAVLWLDGNIINLGTLPGDSESTAYAINDNGQIVGSSTGPNGTRGFIWQNGVMTDLGGFEGNQYIQPQDINNAGQVVGFAQPVNSIFVRSTAFTWSKGSYRNLNPVVGQSGVYGCRARAVSELGHIAGSCITNMYRLTPVADAVDVSIEMLTTPVSTVRQGEPLVYSIRVINTGSLPASGIAVADTLPADVTFISAVTTQGVCSVSSALNCSIGNLAPGSVATVTLTVTPTVLTYYMPNTATVTSNETDVNPQNNSSTTAVWVQAAIVYADLSVSVAGPSTVKPRSNITYTYTVKNDGPGDATTVTLTNNVAANLFYVSSSTTQGSCGGVSCSLGTMKAGSTATVTLVLRPLLRGTYTSKSSLTFGAVDNNKANNSTSITTVVK